MSNQTDQETLRRLVAVAERDGLDPVLKQQLETTLHAQYAFNAKYPHIGLIFVWIARAFSIGALIGMYYGFDKTNYVQGLVCTLVLGFSILLGAAMKHAYKLNLKLARDYKEAMAAQGGATEPY